MGIVPRIALAVVILLVDFVSFLVPLGSMVIAYVIVARPQWARDFVARLYGEDGPAAPEEAAEPERLEEPARGIESVHEQGGALAEAVGEERRGDRGPLA